MVASILLNSNAISPTLKCLDANCSKLCAIGSVPIDAPKPCPVKSPKNTYKPPAGLGADNNISPLNVEAGAI